MLTLSNKKEVKRLNRTKSALIIVGFLAFVLIAMYLGGACFKC